MPRPTRIAAVAVPITLLLAACGDAAMSPSGSFAHSAVSQPGPAELPSDAQGTSGGGGAPAEAPAPQANGSASSSVLNAPANGAFDSATKDVAPAISLGTPQGRIERSVDAHFVVPHGGFLDAFDALIERAANLGGFVLSSTTSPGDGGRVDSGQLVVRVPTAKLNDMVTGTPKSWQTSSINYGSVDHTAETIDLNARLKAITAHRDALQKLLDNTTNLNDITSLENQLADVQQQLDQIQGQLDSVNNRVDMATATISLREKGAVTPPAPSPTPRLVSALHDGWNNAVAVVSAVTLALFSVLPVLVVALFGLVVWLRLRRRAAQA